VKSTPAARGAAVKVFGPALEEVRRVFLRELTDSPQFCLREMTEVDQLDGGPDHVTLLGFAAMTLVRVVYALSAREPVLLFAVDLALVLSWLGDSVDRTLARHRRAAAPTLRLLWITWSTHSARCSCPLTWRRRTG